MTVSENDRLDIVRRKEKVPEDLAGRIARLEAKEAIRDLQMQYSHLCDAHDWEGVLSLCTDDVERILGGTLEETVQGKEALRERYNNPSLKRASDGVTVPSLAVDKIYHLVATPIVRISNDGNKAWSTQYTSLVSIKDTDDEFARGVHETTSMFTYVKKAGEWKISQMVLISNLANDPLWRAHYKK
jgi:hypothetical protein